MIRNLYHSESDFVLSWFVCECVRVGGADGAERGTEHRNLVAGLLPLRVSLLTLLFIYFYLVSTSKLENTPVIIHNVSLGTVYVLIFMSSHSWGSCCTSIFFTTVKNFMTSYLLSREAYPFPVDLFWRKIICSNESTFFP